MIREMARDPRTPVRPAAPVPTPAEASALLRRARRLARGPERRILGITGPPGSGKSTLAAWLVDRLGAAAACLVAMDGFHLAQEQLRRLGRSGRKGAPDTFDAHGYAALLRSLRERPAHTIYAPRFHREIEEPIAGAVAVDPAVPLVVTEGNYLLIPVPPWDAVRALLDECWYCDLDEETRLSRLYARHRAFGKAPAQARRWTDGPDQANARLVAAARALADVRVRMA
jgi:pantothenate kinase